MDAASRITDVDDVPKDDTLLFTVEEVGAMDSEEKEAILVRQGDEISAWRNYCMHWTDVKLDRGSGAPVRNGDIVCRKHGATFEKDSGECTFGPCEGAVLESVEITVADDAVFLVDDNYEFVRLGESAEKRDLSTSPGERLGF